MEIESGDAPAGTLAEVAVEPDQEGRPPEPLDYSGRNDPDDPGMPAVRSEHDARRSLEIDLLLDPIDRLGEDPLIEVLPLGVHLLEPARDRPRFFPRVGKQERETEAGVADSPGRVQPGTEDEADVRRFDLLTREAGGRDQRLKPGP